MQKPASKKPLDKIREEHAGGGEGAKEEKKPRKQRKSKLIYTPEQALDLCKMPFGVAEAMTGFAWKMPEQMEPIVGMSGAEVLNEFGIEKFHKYIMLGVFIAAYGSCCAMWFKSYRMAIAQAEKKTLATEPSKPLESKPEPEHKPEPVAAAPH